MKLEEKGISWREQYVQEYMSCKWQIPQYSSRSEGVGGDWQGEWAD